MSPEIKYTKLYRVLSELVAPLSRPSKAGKECKSKTPVVPHRMRSKEEWLKTFKGTDVIIPDLYALLPGWRFAVNDHYESVKTKLNEWMRSWVDSKEDCRRMELADFAMLAGCFYPDADEEEYLMVAYYHLWVFVWDDEIDCGPLRNDLEGISRFKKETDRCLEETLGSKPHQDHHESLLPVMKAFSELARPIVAGTTPNARKYLLRELSTFVDGACALPFRRTELDEKELFTREHFLAQRACSGGAGPSMVLVLYLHHLNIPSLILEHEAVQTIYAQSCLIVHLINDIVSVVKELRNDQIDNIVPVLAIDHGISLQAAIERACGLVVIARQELEDAEKRLPLSGNEEADRQLMRYVQGCKDVAAGNLHWSYKNARYFGRNPKRDGNVIYLHI